MDKRVRPIIVEELCLERYLIGCGVCLNRLAKMTQRFIPVELRLGFILALKGIYIARRTKEN